MSSIPLELNALLLPSRSDWPVSGDMVSGKQAIRGITDVHADNW